MKRNRVAIYAKFGGACAYCGIPISLKGMQVDHVQAKFRFGTNEEANLFPACASCNNWKHSFTVDEFRAELEAQPARLRKYSSQFRIAERFGMLSLVNKPIVFRFEQIKPSATPQ